MSQLASPVGHLVLDVYDTIFSFADKATLQRCRLLNRTLEPLATRLAFRHVTLSASERGQDAGVTFSGRFSNRFSNIALSESLRLCVRKVTLDTSQLLSISDDFDEAGSELNDRVARLEFLVMFLSNIPLIVNFPGLETLSVRFNDLWVEAGDNDGDNPIEFVETPPMRFLFLNTIFQCLDGSFVPDDSTLSEFLGIVMGLDFVRSQMVEVLVANWARCLRGTDSSSSKPPSTLLTIIVANLADLHDSRLAASTAFKRVMATRVKALKLHIATQIRESAWNEGQYLIHQYKLMEKLPSTWIASDLALNLQVLALHCRGYFGWAPKFDWRHINPGRGPSSGLPKLRVLSLGNFVLSHQWQVEWIASLGRENGCGGLEELHLDRTPIMHFLRGPQPQGPDDTTTVTNSRTGKRMTFSDEGFCTSEEMANIWMPAVVEVPYSLRWWRVLSYWREAMAALKVFKVGAVDEVDPFGDHRPLLETWEEARHAGLWYTSFDHGLGPQAWGNNWPQPMTVGEKLLASILDPDQRLVRDDEREYLKLMATLKERRRGIP